MRDFIRVNDTYEDGVIESHNTIITRSVTPPTRTSEFTRSSMFLDETEGSQQNDYGDDTTSDKSKLDRSLLTLATDLRKQMNSGRDFTPFKSPGRSNRIVFPYQNEEEMNDLDNPSRPIETRKSNRRKNHSHRKSKAARETAAIFYSECYLRGIGRETSDKAVRESHDKYKKWWNQEINHSGTPGSLGDSFLVPRFRQTLRPKLFFGNDEKLHQGDLDNGERPSKNYVSLEKEEKNIESTNNRIQRIDHSKYLCVTHDDYSCPYFTENTESSRIQVPQVEVPTMKPNLTTQYSSGFVENIRRYDNIIPGKLMKFDEVLNDTSKSNRSSIMLPVLNDLEKQSSSNLGREYGPIIRRPIPLRAEISAIKQLNYTPHSSSKIHQYAAFDSSSKHSEQIGYEHQNEESSEKGENLSTNSMVAESRLTKRQRLNFAHRNITGDKHVSYQNDQCPELHKHAHVNICPLYGRGKNLTKNSIKDGSIPIIENSLLCGNQDVAQKLKMELLKYLACSGGDVTDKRFLGTLEQLHQFYQMTGWDACSQSRKGNYFGEEKRKLDGMWLTLSRPNFEDCIGRNSEGDYMYTLGRMSFDMFRPVNLVCSINAVFNLIKSESFEEVASVPKSLRNTSTSNAGLFSFEIITAFTIECDSFHFGNYSPNSAVREPIQGIMTANAHVLPDPKTPNRLSVWFTGGDMKPNNSTSNKMRWKKVFGSALPKRRLLEHARILAAKLLLGAHIPETMEDDGTMRYEFSRPIGGHGVAYLDVLYLDDTLRILQGHRGTIYVHLRVPVVSN